eukprot:CAMPEP_0119119866 /NCGR_PEP_ID=MMETSP1310-20130426/1171_1 /TAXON_ID=464262 /ORGANISM="Genus nov. species nov., Strain RCC2339" /LENGTH=164 /DNA_ID=CAMNT_0007109321 /DNA_START=179 /DNA_END=671 /DNA_ORIENTATION=-
MGFQIPQVEQLFRDTIGKFVDKNEITMEHRDAIVRLPPIKLTYPPEEELLAKPVDLAGTYDKLISSNGTWYHHATTRARANLSFLFLSRAVFLCTPDPLTGAPPQLAADQVFQWAKLLASGEVESYTEPPVHRLVMSSQTISETSTEISSAVEFGQSLSAAHRR